MTLRATKVTTWPEYRKRVAAWIPSGLEVDQDGLDFLRSFDDPGIAVRQGAELFARCPHCERVFAPVEGEALIHMCPVSKQKERLQSRMASVTVRLEIA